MTKTLWAFGDSHTAGAEIDRQYSESCYDKAYPAYVAKYFGFEYKNCAKSGGSNDWALVEFNNAIRTDKNIFVLFNFLEPSRTFFYEKSLNNDPIVHCVPNMLSDSFIKELSTNFKGLSREQYKEYLNWLRGSYIEDYKKISSMYRSHLKKYSDKQLNDRCISQIMYVQNKCEEYKIPYVFHSSCSWYYGSWSLISKKNFYGHTKNFYSDVDSSINRSLYSFWGIATENSNWNHIMKEDRWSKHYPEEYHRYYASLLINFINNQNILEGLK